MDGDGDGAGYSDGNDDNDDNRDVDGDGDGADKRDDQFKRDDEKIYNGERISLTFRDIGTFRRRCDSAVFGQGGIAKSERDHPHPHPHPIAITERDETEAMLVAFGIENSSAEFDWHTHYGCGFNVINMNILRDADES